MLSCQEQHDAGVPTLDKISCEPRDDCSSTSDTPGVHGRMLSYDIWPHCVECASVGLSMAYLFYAEARDGLVALMFSALHAPADETPDTHHSIILRFACF